MHKLVVVLIVATISALGAVVPSSPAGAVERPEWEVSALPAVEGDPDYSQVHFWVCAPWELADGPYVVEYSTSDGTATAGEDYVATSGSVTLLPMGGSRCFEVVVDTIDDDVLEGVPFKITPREYFHLDLTTAGVGEEIYGDATRTPGYVYDGLDDWPAIIDLTRATVSEGNTSGMYIWVHNPKPYPVTVRWGTEAMSADADDFVAREGEVTFAPGEREKWVSIPTVDDGTDEPSEVFRVVLSDPRPADESVIDPHAWGRITIEDDDPMTHLSVGDVTVPAPDSDTDGPVSAQFTVSLNEPSGHIVVVDYATEDGTLTAGEDYDAVSGSLAFGPGVTSQTVKVPLTAASPDLAGGTLALNLDDPENATLGNARGTATVAVAEAEDGHSADPAGETPTAVPDTAADPVAAAFGSLTPASPVEPSPVPTAAGAVPPTANRRAAPTSEPSAGAHGGDHAASTMGSAAPPAPPASAQAAESPGSSRPSERLLPRAAPITADREALYRLSGAASGLLALVIAGWALALERRHRPFVRGSRPAG